MIRLRSRTTKFSSGRRHPTVKITRAERRANKEAREELTRALAPVLEDSFEDFRADSEELLQALRVQGSTDPRSIAFPIGPLEQSLEGALGTAFEEAIDRGSKIGLRFSGIDGIDVDPELITRRGADWIASTGASRIADLTASATQQIRETVAEALRDDISPEEAAQRISRQIGLSPRDAQALRNFEAEQVRLLIPTPEADTQLVRETIADSVERRRKRLLRNRSRLIAETEMQEAIQEGEQAFWQEAIATDQVEPATLVKRWFTVQDDRVCPICEPLHGVGILFDEDFVSTGGAGFVGPRPPAHLRCRCYLSFEPNGTPDEDRRSAGAIAVAVAVGTAAALGAAALIGGRPAAPGAQIIPLPRRTETRIQIAASRRALKPKRFNKRRRRFGNPY